jgi:dihydroorotate dehydrogenase electron transfer subunit
MDYMRRPPVSAVRGIIPPRMSANRLAPLVRNQPLDGPYVLLTFEHPEVASHARAGQFVMIKAGASAEPPLRRPFSVLETNAAAGTFTLFLKIVGQGSRLLAALRPGDVAQCLGPLGRPFEAPSEDEEALMVAGGYGIAPFLMLSREIQDRGSSGRIFYGGRTARDVQVPEPFASLSVTIVAATEDGSVGHRGRVTEPLLAYLDERGGRAAALSACGPEPMLRAVTRIARERGLPCQVSLDPWMGCGVGTCLACVVRIQRAVDERPKYRCACTEGPVFDASTVVWDDESAPGAER